MASVVLVASQASAGPATRVVYKFAASAPLFARPGVGSRGAVYVGAGDGYVHALGPQGSFRWSYTVKGRVVAPPVEEASSERVFVATSEGRLYALEKDSTLRWVFPLPVAPKTELLLTSKGTLFFVGQDDHLYGITTGGALSLRLAAMGARSAPALLEGRHVSVVLGQQLAILKGYGYERASLTGSFGASAMLALGDNGAVYGCEGGVARAVGDSRELGVESDCLSPPVRGEGFFAVARASGDVRLLFDDGTDATVAVGAAPLRPVWDAARRRLIVATASGSVVVLELSENP